MRRALPLYASLALTLGGCVSQYIEGQMTYEQEPLELEDDAGPRRDQGAARPLDADAPPPRPPDMDVFDPCQGVACGPYGDCANGICLCRAGGVYNAQGQCVAEGAEGCTRDSECPLNERCQGGICYCPAPYAWDGQGVCRPADPCASVSCPAHARCQGGACVCDGGYHMEGAVCVLDAPDDPCLGLSCPAHSRCQGGRCVCDPGYHVANDACVLDAPCGGACRADQICVAEVCRCPAGQVDQGGACVLLDDPCDGEGCSGRGECMTHALNDGTISTVCACQVGFTPSTSVGMDCVPTAEVCAGGQIPSLGVEFTPTSEECALYEGINLNRALADERAVGLCFTPLPYSLLWSYHARAHSEAMEAAGASFAAEGEHALSSGAQLLAPAGNLDNQIDALTRGGPCPDGSPWCALLGCDYLWLGVGRSPQGWSALNLSR
ncbi:hypothetical protein KKF91_02105 [Myxococcota bacterium]|nr:hypothetical protein [Myxococcota bacterium]